MLLHVSGFWANQTFTCGQTSLNKGELTKPTLYFDFYERKQGIRIVRLMKRVPAHKANLNDDYALIKQAAESDKRTRIINKWVDSKLGNVYIRIDSEYLACPFLHQWVNN